MRLSPYNPANLMRDAWRRPQRARKISIEAARPATPSQGADLRRHLSPSGGPKIRIHATDLYHRVPFPFVAPVFSITCAAISRVTAWPMRWRRRWRCRCCSRPSSCVPIRKTVSRSPPEFAAIGDKAHLFARASTGSSGQSPPTAIPRSSLIKLADGGLTDNFAVSTLIMSRYVFGRPYAPLTERDAVRIRRLLLAGRGRPAGPERRLDPVARPGRAGSISRSAATDAAIDSAARHAADALGRHDRGMAGFDHRVPLRPRARRCLSVSGGRRSGTAPT